MLGTGQLGTTQLGSSEEEAITAGYAQAAAFISKLKGLGQAQAYIYNPYLHAQAQAHIVKTDIEGLAQAQAAIKPRNGILRKSNTGVYSSFRGPGMPEAPDFHNFTGSWGVSAAFVADETGTWNFRTYVDFSGQFFINNTQLTDQTYTNSPYVSSNMSLVAGQVYTFHMDYFGEALPNVLRMWYQRPSDTEFHYFTDNAPPWIQEFISLKSGQAQAYISPAFDQSVVGQAQAKIGRGYGYSQAQARLIAFGVNKVAQAQARILILNTIAYDATSSGSGSGVVSWTHTPVFDPPKGIIVTAGVPNLGNSVSAVSYGGEALSLVATFARSSGAQSRSYVWFLGSNIPSGPQTVEVTSSQSGQFQAFSVSALNDIEVLDSGGGSGTSSFSEVMSYNNRVGLTFVSAVTTASPTLLTNEELVRAGSVFNGTARIIKQITATDTDFTAGWSNSVTNYSVAVGSFAQIPFKGFGQATALIDSAIKIQSGNAQASIKAIGRGFGQAQARILATINRHAQAQAQIKQTYQSYAQAEATISTSQAQGYGQAEAWIEQTYREFAQAQAKINAFDVNAFGQAESWIKQTYSNSGQAQAFIIPPTYWGQAQARIIGFDIPRFGQAQADILVTTFASGNAKAQIAKSVGFGQALAQIKTSRNWARGQARAFIGARNAYGQAEAFISKSAGYGQAEAWIEITTRGTGQAQAFIFQTRFFPTGQAQASILQVYQVYAQAQAQITVTWRMGQAQAWIEQTFLSHAQALARIKQTYRPVAQANAVIKIRYYVHGQAQARLNIQTFGHGNAQAFINNFRIGQAQARIFSVDYPRVGQAQGYILPSSVFTPPGGPTSEAHTYLVRYNNHDLPGYAQSESYDSVVNIVTNYAAAMDGGLSEYTGLINKSINLVMKAWEPTYEDVKNKVRLATTLLRSAKGFTKLYVQQPDAYFLAMVKRIQIAKTVGESTRVLDYEIEFEAKPWLISNDTYEISGTGAISTINRTFYDGGWTPTRIIISGTDVEITATTATGDPAGHIEIEGTCNNLVIDSDNFTAIENGLNRNDILLTKDYAIYVGPGTTNFQIDGATSCVIQWNNRWYLASNKGASLQPIATTPVPTTLTQLISGLATATITSGIKQATGLVRAVISEPIKKKAAQAQALIHSPITNAHAQARAFLRSGRTWTHAQAQARIRVIGNEGVGQSRAFIEGNTKYKVAQARATIRVHTQLKQGQARAKIATLPPTPASFTATAGDEEVTLTWS